MAANPDVTVRPSTAMEGRSQETKGDDAPRARERVMSPAVDIFEDDQRITVLADIPGVSREGLDVRVDRNNLVIEGAMAIDPPPGMQALYADVQAMKYRRDFTLTGELDAEHIDATLKDGVLTVHIPKRKEFRTRKIQVNVA